MKNLYKLLVVILPVFRSGPSTKAGQRYSNKPFDYSLFMCIAHNNVRKNKKLSAIEFTLLYFIFCHGKESSVLAVASVL